MFTVSSVSQKTLAAIRSICGSTSLFVQRSAQSGDNVALYATFKCTCLISKSLTPSQPTTGLPQTFGSLSRCDTTLLKSESCRDMIIPNIDLSQNGSDRGQLTPLSKSRQQAHTRSIEAVMPTEIRWQTSGRNMSQTNFLNQQIRNISTRSRRKIGLRESRKLSTKGDENFKSDTKSTSVSSDTKEEVEDEKQLTLYQRFKKTYKEHGKVLVAVHLATSVVWFGSFYTIARCGVDIVPYLENWNLSEKIISPFRSGGLGDVALAYLMYKLATPARYTVTIGGTRLAISYLRKEGKMQPVPKGDTLRELYKEGRADLESKSRSRLRTLRKRRGKRPPPGKDH